jgi:hypothetical protein
MSEETKTDALAVVTPDIEGQGLLTEFEHAALLQHRQKKGQPGLSPHLEAQLYELFLQGIACEAIAKQNPGISVGQILEARLQHDWDGRYKRYLEDLFSKAKGSAEQIHLEALEFLRTYIAVVHKAFGAKAKKFLQTGNPKDLPNFEKGVSWKQYKQQIELLLKLTGQTPPERTHVSGTVTHEHHLTLSSAQPQAAVLPGGMTSDEADTALAALEEASRAKKP